MIYPLEDLIQHQREKLGREPAQNVYINRKDLTRLLDAAEGKKES